ncbi:DsrE family protein [Endozoicomonas lisbonensis]|uniref:tRNA 2-thiouridine synthesizing protein D n=1 Tax=Endozoicomonas lisbonensis TaxID=3120522 RepID=A0ABV2SGN9_9GAMM
MSEQKTLTFALMDAPFENSRTTTAFRLLDIAAREGHNLKVFAYEGAVGLAFARQRPHANAVHGRDVDEEDHPLSHKWVIALHKLAEASGGSLEWINCGLCVDERGMDESVEGVGRGSPADLWKFASASDNTLIIPTR